MKKKTFIFLSMLCCLFVATKVTGQNAGLLISGKVSSGTDKETLPGVSIKLKGTTTGTSTDVNGKYSIKLPSGDGVLIFSYIGHRTKEIAVNGQARLDVVLEPDVSTMDEVLIVGYTQQSRSKTTAAISKLSPDELKNTANPNPVQALQGKIAGVSVPVTTGQPGVGATNIIIRGGTKPNAYGSGLGNNNGSSTGASDANSPLVVVDGVFRSMNDVNPDNIESMQVMKDAASTAIYGARGANGVIVIKTKSGNANGKMSISLNHRTTWETQARDYDYLNAEEYLRLARTTVKNTADALDKNNLLNNGGFSAGTKVYTAKGQYGKNINLTALYDNIVSVEGQAYVDNLLSKGWKVMDDPINPGTRLLYADNNYQDMLWNTGLSNNENLGISGGSEKSDYNLSMGYTNQAGVFVGTKYKRYDALGNFGFKAADNFRLDVMLNYQNVMPNYVDAYQNDLVRAVRITPLIRTFKDDGNPMPGELYTVRNRFHTLKYDDTRTSTERLVSRVAGDLTIIKGLHFKPSFSYLIDDYKELFMRKGTPADEIQPATQRQKTDYTRNSRQLMIDQVLQYDFSLQNAHNFMVLAGVNYTRNTNHIASLGSQRGSNDYIYTIDEPSTTIVNGVVVTNVTNFGTSIGETRSASAFGQFNYDYKAKYLLTGSLRYDGFSNFTPENKYAFFPSVSVGWNIHKEEFWNLKAVNALKLRASWGTAGLSDLSITDTYGGYTTSSYALGSGILRANLANPNLKWESTATTDLAFDASFFNSRINLTVDYYNKLTKDRLDSKPLPSESPFASITFNNGELRNRGVEIELGAAIVKTRDFNWNTNLSFSYNQQLITKLPANGRLKNRQGGDLVFDPASNALVERGGFAEGERPFPIYAYRVTGVFATDAEAAAWNAKVKDNLASPQGIAVGKRGGDFIFDDVNGDGVIDTKDQVFMGYRNPNKMGGMQNTFTYKNLSLRFTMDYALGHLISNGALARSLGQGRAFNEGAPAIAIGPDIWQNQGDTDKKYARFSFADFDFGQRNYLRNGTLGNNNGYNSDVSAMFSKGNFLAFREISIAYDIPKKILNKIRASGLNIFATIYNVGYLTAYEGLNPEVYTGFDPGGYPRPRQFLLGATLKF
ncbi:TonB-linked SusC/RagA family outer membrane protein [Pedobacter sp. AK017]|uniref:SusC/RagA family TonB-linked outer membrane protein n=1 Tax=Pedobacter sp. AK017 TaxID=2723073 RepID=UPI00160E70CD|nr:SusC/RagA family TonB-linked outer membrane protein [Pedobacter sp. AK017]MBB5440725.1 TonB-linked SusC/RagA family outer membrane protein [Pedobacter sp. AK017]